jgi:hypothetical protein
MVYLDGDTFDWMHFLETAFGGIVAFTTFGALFWAIFSYYDKDRKKRNKEEHDKEEARAESERQALIKAADLAEKKNDVRHQENQNAMHEMSGKMSKMNLVLRFLRLHRHKECGDKTPLLVEGIDYGPDDEG